MTQSQQATYDLQTGPLAQLVYRSAAVGPMGPAELHGLLERARQRNAHESITGLLVFDQGRFIQWLEGPAEGVERVWESIQRDPRHAEVERLHTPWHPHRLFPDWRMQFGALDEQGSQMQGMPMSDTALHGLRQTADTAAEFMGSVSFWRSLPPVTDMLVSLTAHSDSRFEGLVSQAISLKPSMTALGLHLLSPTAQALGDAWRADRCDSSTLLMAQLRLQQLMRRVVATWQHAERRAHRRALVALVPGETHLTGLTFASLALDAAGWAVDCGFPRSNEELQALVSQENYEVLHLALSDAFEREERLGDLATTIRAARRASRQRELQVLVSGRAFAQQQGLAVAVGADGDGLAQGSESPDLEAMLAWARIRRQTSGAVVAKSVVEGLARSVQHRHFGDGE